MASLTGKNRRLKVLLLLVIINFTSDPCLNLIFFSVFNVIDHNGNKIRDKDVIDYIQRVGVHILAFFKLVSF